MILTLVYATGLGYWNSQIDLVNWKTRYDVETATGSLCLYSVTLQIQPLVGNAG